MNQQKSLTQLIVENYKYIFVLVLTSQTFILLTGNIDYNNPIYANSDLNKYLEMAKASPLLTEDVIKPFVYRIIIPWLVGIMPFSIHTNFQIINHFSLILFTISAFLFFRDSLASAKIAFVLTFSIQLNRYVFLLNSWNYFQVCDVIALSLIFLGFVLIKRKNWILMLIIFPISVLVKEYVLMILPAGFFYLIFNKSRKEDLLYFSLISILSILVFIIIRQIIISDGGESLFVQYTTQVIYYSKPILLIKRFIIPFTPFGLVVLFFYKELIIFFRDNPHYLIFTFTVIILSFFGEPERLMAPLSSVVYLFVGKLLLKIIDLNDFQKKEIIFYTTFLILVVVGSFYHLWGIVKLPNKELSMLITIFVNIGVVILLFITEKFPKKSSNIRRSF